MRRAYNTPFVLMLIAAVLVLVYNSVIFRPLIVERRLSVYVLVMYLIWPVILLGEAMVYLIVRRRIYDRRSALVHLWLVYFGFLILPLLFMVLARVMPYGLWLRYIFYVRLFLFWGTFIIGHIYFGRVLARRPAPLPESSDGENILDDVLD